MITKAVIPAAGFGTRMLPAAKAVPKEMLPVLDRPTIQYVIEECAAAGAGDVMLITSRDKKSIEDHFDRAPELEDKLEAAGKADLLQSITTLMSRVRLHATRQARQLGLGHAVLQAREHVNAQPFLCLLGDTIFSGDVPPAQQLTDAHARFGGSIIGLEEVAADKVERYGIVGGAEIAPGVLKLDKLVEKPRISDAPSRYAIAARYLLSPAVFDCLEQTTPGAGGEIQLTDALQSLLRREPVFGVVLSARRHDIGNPIDWLKTNLTFAARDPAVWSQIEPHLRALLK